MANTFQGIEHATREDYLNAIAVTYIEADGLNSREFVISELAKTSAEELARDLLNNWTFDDVEQSDLVPVFEDMKAHPDRYLSADLD